MKTIARLTVAAFAALALLASPASAGDFLQQEVLWEPATATSIALSKTLDTSGFETLTVFVKPIFVSGAADRVTTISCLRSNGDEVFAFDADTATTVAPSMIVISGKNWDDDGTNTTKPTGSAFFTAEPCVKTKISIAAASGPFRAYVTGIRRRKQ